MLEDRIADIVADLTRRGIEDYRLQRFAELMRAGKDRKAWLAVNRPLCGARTRSGRPCVAPGILKGGRCRMHGGLSTGPRTEAGRRAIGEASRRRAAAKRAAIDIFS